MGVKKRYGQVLRATAKTRKTYYPQFRNELGSSGVNMQHVTFVQVLNKSPQMTLYLMAKWLPVLYPEINWNEAIRRVKCLHTSKDLEDEECVRQLISSIIQLAKEKGIQITIEK